MFGGQGCWVGFSGQAASEASDGVFDAAFLPWGSGIAEVGFDADLAAEALVFAELAAIVEGDGLAQRWCEGCEQIGQAVSDAVGLEAGLRRALVNLWAYAG